MSHILQLINYSVYCQVKVLIRLNLSHLQFIIKRMLKRLAVLSGGS